MPLQYVLEISWSYLVFAQVIQLSLGDGNHLPECNATWVYGGALASARRSLLLDLSADGITWPLIVSEGQSHVGLLWNG